MKQVCADENGIQAGVGAAFMAVEKNAVLLVVIDPELPEGGFAFAWVQAADGGFVYFDVVGLAEARGNQIVEGQQALGKVEVPVAHEVAVSSMPWAALSFHCSRQKGL